MKTCFFERKLEGKLGHTLSTPSTPLKNRRNYRVSVPVEWYLTWSISSYVSIPCGLCGRELRATLDIDALEILDQCLVEFIATLLIDI